MAFPLDRRQAISIRVPAKEARAKERAVVFGTAPLLLLPACHQGVYARLLRAMEKVGLRGRFRESELVGRARTPAPPPSPRRGGAGRAGERRRRVVGKRPDEAASVTSAGAGHRGRAGAADR